MQNYVFCEYESHYNPSRLELLLSITAADVTMLWSCCILRGPDDKRILDVVPRRDGARNSG